MTDPARLAAVDAVLAEALDREPAERAAFLEERCAGDATLRGEVEALLRYAESDVEGVLAPIR